MRPVLTAPPAADGNVYSGVKSDHISVERVKIFGVLITGSDQLRGKKRVRKKK